MKCYFLSLTKIDFRLLFVLFDVWFFRLQNLTGVSIVSLNIHLDVIVCTKKEGNKKKN